MSVLTTPPPNRAGPRVSAGEVDAGVIRDARRRQRRRRATLTLAMLGVGLAVGLALSPGGRSPSGVRSRDNPPSSSLTLDPGALFSQAPYMGVACGVANSIACDRIGLTVWLREPAMAATATIAGRTFRLDNPAWSGPAHHGQRTVFAGFLRPAGITTRLGVTTQHGTHWDGSDGPNPLVILHLTRLGQPPTQAWVNVLLMAGWG